VVGQVIDVLAGDKPDEIADLALVVVAGKPRERAGIDFLACRELG
jgi:hypothetical protein